MSARNDEPPSITPRDIADVLGGAAAFGSRPETQADLDRAIRNGLPLACLAAAMSADILRANERYVVFSRIRRWLRPHSRLSAREGARLVRVTRATLHARALLSVPEQTAEWMREPMFDGHSALRFARSARGLALVEEFLWRQFFGIYS